MKETDAQPRAAWQLAYRWLCERRKKASPNADIWHLRWRWQTEGAALYSRVCAGHYRLSPMLVVGRGNDAVAMWSAQDALVLKWVALLVQYLLPQHQACMHLSCGGVMRCVGRVANALGSTHYRFVHRTDIRNYYAQISKLQVMAQVERYVTDPVLYELIEQYVFYSVEKVGEIHTSPTGIPRGCALSPIIGGSLLHHIDSHNQTCDTEDSFYVRYMDDFLLLTRTRWQLRRGIAILATHFNSGGFERHPDKTQTGRVEKGFDWLGVWFGPEGPSLSPRAVNNHRERRLRLYERAPARGACRREASTRVQAYVARWQTWGSRLLNAASP